MARINYYGIEEAIQLQLQEQLSGPPTVLIEEELLMQSGDAIIIYLDRRDAPPEDQKISAGHRTNFDIRLTIACYHSGLEKKAVMQARDNLVANVELALMSDNTFGGVVDASWIIGGEFENARNQGGSAGFVSVGTIEIMAQLSAAN